MPVEGSLGCPPLSPSSIPGLRVASPHFRTGKAGPLERSGVVPGSKKPVSGLSLLSSHQPLTLLQSPSGETAVEPGLSFLTLSHGSVRFARNLPQQGCGRSSAIIIIIFKGITLKKKI